MNSEKILRKSRLKEAYAAIPDGPAKTAVAQDYAALLAENDLSDRMLARHLSGSLLPAIAIYRTLPAYGWKPAEARWLVRTAIMASARPMARWMQRLGKLPFFFLLFRVACPASMKTGYGEEGWQFTWKRNDADAIEWDCHACFYVDVLKRYGMIELAPIFCDFDDMVYGNIPAARWGRTKTIGRGAEVCDFSFYNTRRMERLK